MNERMERFIALLNQMFEMDKSDLDFGIYRILNIRRDEIQKFFKEGLPKQIKETLAPFAQGNKDELRQKIADIESQCGGADNVAMLPDSMPMKQQYNSLKAQLQQGTDLSALESDVYSALYNFFSRYYDEGDFISKRRYKEGVYAIPYEGEEVKLYWANQDQYYIKTSENFKDYTFKTGDYIVHFLLVDATTEQNNNQETDDKKRQFMLFTEDEEKYPGIKTFEYKEEEIKEGNEKKKEKIVNIRFIFDIPEDKKAKYYDLNVAGIKQWLSTQPTNVMMELLRIANPDAKTKDQISIIEKHLKAYIAKNTFDYFIHKDLGGFLTRELDFFIKNEVMHLDDLDTGNEAKVETYIAKVRAIKQVGRVIIKFLAQIENFQKKLWLKKKFVVETNWCITLDRIPEKYYDEIRQNKAQVQEWVDMYAINELETDLDHTEPFTEVPSILFLKQNPNLIVDTKHFSEEFKNRLMAEFEDLDKKTGGLLLNSDNYQAIRLLKQTYNGKIKLEYTDPPYNTDASKILYKNGYEHSSWVSLIHSRLIEAKELLSSNGIIQVAIDDYEFRYLNCCMDSVFGIDNSISNVAILTNPKGRDQGFIAQAHDYTIMYAKDKRFAETFNFILSKEELAKKFSKVKDGESLRELPLKRTGSGKFREDRPYMFFPFFYNDVTNKLFVIPKEEYIQIYDKDTDSFNDSFLSSIISKYKEQGYDAILPISSKGEYFRWRWGYKSCCDGVDNGTLFCKKIKGGGYAIYQYDLADDEARPKSLWVGERYDASSKGTNVLESMIPNCPFKYPKSLYTVMDNIIIGADNNDTICDFFGGSGTTAHAVIELNRNEEDSKRKYVLIEMGDYFSTVTLVRTLKSIYSPDWKDGKPLSRNKGISHIMKYLRLESYEDALSNIELKKNNGMAGLFGDDYMINYMLDIEAKGSLLNLKAFKTPFSYEMNITEKNESKPQRVDVCETFNYLIGLTVQRQGVIRSYDSIPAAKPEYEGAVDLVKGTQFAFRQIEGTLPDGRKALVIWRTIGEDLKACNAALDAYFEKYRINPHDREYDVIYVNGDNNLENLCTADETWKVVLIEQEFNKRMFEEE